MEGNEATPAPAGEDKVNRKLVDRIFEKIKNSIAVEPVEGEVKVTKKVTLASGSGLTFYVADEQSEKAAKVALQLLSLKYAVDMAEALKDPEKLAEILSL
jgi:hypothetical protein